MAKQVKLLSASHKKVQVPAVLMNGDRYICAERLMTAAWPGIGKEEKRSLSKKLAALAETQGGAFRAKLAGADRWFVTRQLLGACLERELRTHGNATYARFAEQIRNRMRELMAMIALSEKLGKRGFHRTETMLSPEIDMSAQKGALTDIEDAVRRAAELLDGTMDGGCPNCGAKEADGEKPVPDGDAAGDEGYAAGIAELLDAPAALPVSMMLKLRDRLAVLAMVSGTWAVYKGANSDAMDLMTIREAVLDPGREITRSEWLSAFGIMDADPVGSDIVSEDAHERRRKRAAACAGVWDSGTDGPVPSMTAMRLLLNCMSRP